jgi:hypothetical protein
MRWLNLGAFLAAAALLGLVFPRQGQFGHRIAAIGLVFLAVLMFRNPVRVSEPLKFRSRDFVDRLVAFLRFALMMAGVIVRYAHDL